MNKTTIHSLLMSNNHAVELVILGLYARQTVGEQHTSTTIESNGRGFNYHHAEYGTYLAKWLQSGRHLTGSHLVRARRMSCFYWRQVSEMSQVIRLLPPPAPPARPVVIRHHDMLFLLAQYDRFQQFA
jgi:hypothetical protein